MGKMPFCFSNKDSYSPVKEFSSQFGMFYYKLDRKMMRRFRFDKNGVMTKSTPSLDVLPDANSNGNAFNGQNDNSTDYNSVEDDMSTLDGNVLLEIVLPGGKEIKMEVDANTPMMDLLVQVTARNGISPGGLMLKVPSDRPPGYISYKPSTAVGRLDTERIEVVPKSEMSDKPKVRKPRVANQPFEKTVRVQVDLPRQQKTVVRLSPATSLAEVLRTICDENGYSEAKFHIRAAGAPGLPLDPTLPISEVGTTHFALISKDDDLRRSTGDLFAYYTKMPLEEKNKVKSKGFFGLFSGKKHKKEKAPPPPSQQQRSNSPVNGYGPTPPTSNGATSQHSANLPVIDVSQVIPREKGVQAARPVSMPPPDQFPSTSENRPPPPARKKRPAPKPPVDPPQLVTDQPTNDHSDTPAANPATSPVEARGAVEPVPDSRQESSTGDTGRDSRQSSELSSVSGSLDRQSARSSSDQSVKSRDSSTAKAAKHRYSLQEGGKKARAPAPPPQMVEEEIEDEDFEIPTRENQLPVTTVIGRDGKGSDWLADDRGSKPVQDTSPAQRPLETDLDVAFQNSIDYSKHGPAPILRSSTEDELNENFQEVIATLESDLAAEDLKNQTVKGAPPPILPAKDSSSPHEDVALASSDWYVKSGATVNKTPLSDASTPSPAAVNTRQGVKIRTENKNGETEPFSTHSVVGVEDQSFSGVDTSRVAGRSTDLDSVVPRVSLKEEESTKTVIPSQNHNEEKSDRSLTAEDNLQKNDSVVLKEENSVQTKADPETQPNMFTSVAAVTAGLPKSQSVEIEDPLPEPPKSAANVPPSTPSTVQQRNRPSMVHVHEVHEVIHYTPSPPKFTDRGESKPVSQSKLVYHDPKRELYPTMTVKSFEEEYYQKVQDGDQPYLDSLQRITASLGRQKAAPKKADTAIHEANGMEESSQPKMREPKEKAPQKHRKSWNQPSIQQVIEIPSPPREEETIMKFEVHQRYNMTEVHNGDADSERDSIASEPSQRPKKASLKKSRDSGIDSKPVDSLNLELQIEYEKLQTMFTAWQTTMGEHEAIVKSGSTVEEPRLLAFQKLQSDMVEQHQHVQRLCIAVEAAQKRQHHPMASEGSDSGASSMAADRSGSRQSTHSSIESSVSPLSSSSRSPSPPKARHGESESWGKPRPIEDERAVPRETVDVLQSARMPSGAASEFSASSWIAAAKPAVVETDPAPFNVPLLVAQVDPVKVESKNAEQSFPKPAFAQIELRKVPANSVPVSKDEPVKIELRKVPEEPLFIKRDRNEVNEPVFEKQVVLKPAKPIVPPAESNKPIFPKPVTKSVNFDGIDSTSVVRPSALRSANKGSEGPVTFLKPWQKPVEPSLITSNASYELSAPVTVSKPMPKPILKTSVVGPATAPKPVLKTGPSSNATVPIDLKPILKDSTKTTTVQNGSATNMIKAQTWSGPKTTLEPVKSAVPPPPAPPPPPPVGAEAIVAQMKKVQLKPAGERKTNTLPRENTASADPRDELLAAIRNFGGSNGLKTNR